MSSYESEKSTIYETDNEQSLINESLLSQIAKLINNIININEEKDDYIKNVMDQSFLLFHSNYIPNIALEDYIFRIKKYSQIEVSTFICALIYIDRVILKGLFISQYNIYRLFLACIFDAYKLFEDKRYNINYFSQIGGVSSEELCYLEYEFVCFIDFNLFINESDYLKYFQFLNQKCQIQLNESID